MKNRHSLLLFLACLAPAFAAERPNVLFLIADDLRSEFGAYGASQVKSPHLDGIARRGMTFNRAYCQQAVCNASRSSFMTGTRPDTTKVWGNVAQFRAALPHVVTLGQHFKNQGYFVQGMGKIYHNEAHDDARTWSTPWQTVSAASYARPENVALNARSLTPADPRGPAFEAADVPDDTFADSRIGTLAVATLRELSKKPEPFFLAVGFLKPHLPFVAPKKYWDLYDPAKIELARNNFAPKDAPDYAIHPQAGPELVKYHGIRDGPVPDDLQRQLKHGYYAAISYVDAQVGRVLAELDRLRLREKTIIVFLGDHGWKLGEHDAWAKHSNCESDTNAPLLVAVPGMKHAGARTDALVELVDIYPTLSELAGLPLPVHLEGRSFKPVLDHPGRPWKSAAFSQYPRRVDGRWLMGYTMRTDRYRFTLWVDQSDPATVDAIELYDHQFDPQENTNIARLPDNAELVQALARQCRSGWRAAGPRP